MLVAEAWGAYLEHHTKRWGARHLADHRNLSQAGGAKKRRGKDLATRANSARQGFELFRTFWRWAATRPEYAAVVNVDAIDDKDVREEVPSRKNKKFDGLERAHLGPWFSAVRGLSNNIVSIYLQALVLTGARREEMAELRWQDVDFQWNSQVIHHAVSATRSLLTSYMPDEPRTMNALSIAKLQNPLTRSARSTRCTSPRCSSTSSLDA